MSSKDRKKHFRCCKIIVTKQVKADVFRGSNERSSVSLRD